MLQVQADNLVVGLDEPLRKDQELQGFFPHEQYWETVQHPLQTLLKKTMSEIKLKHENFTLYLLALYSCGTRQQSASVTSSPTQ
jgi:hypothetical protein